jgi:hypothetical protein
MIDIRYTVSKAEYIEAQRLFIKRKRRKSLYSRLVLYVIFVAACAYALLTSKDQMQGASVFVGTAAFIVFAVVVLNRSLQKFALGKRFATESKFLSGVHLILDDTSIRGDVEGIGEAVTQWGAYTGWVEGPAVFAIIGGFTFRPIPRRVLSPDQQSELRDLLTRHIVSTK